MGLDYTEGCVNFRDVGAFINLIADKVIFRPEKLLRGGSIDYVQDVEEIENPKSIFNLRNSHDAFIDGIDYYHFPMSDKIEKYDTSLKEVRIWLNKIIQTFESAELKYPVFIHCLSGKDRTGIVIAIILLILGVETSIIKEEYLLSDGEVRLEWIELAINGIGEIENYFNRVTLQKVRENLLGQLLPV